MCVVDTVYHWGSLHSSPNPYCFRQGPCRRKGGRSARGGREEPLSPGGREKPPSPGGREEPPSPGRREEPPSPGRREEPPSLVPPQKPLSLGLGFLRFPRPFLQKGRLDHQLVNIPGGSPAPAVRLSQGEVHFYTSPLPSPTSVVLCGFPVSFPACEVVCIVHVSCPKQIAHKPGPKG